MQIDVGRGVSHAEQSQEVDRTLESIQQQTMTDPRASASKDETVPPEATPVPEPIHPDPQLQERPNLSGHHQSPNTILRRILEQRDNQTWDSRARVKAQSLSPRPLEGQYMSRDRSPRRSPADSNLANAALHCCSEFTCPRKFRLPENGASFCHDYTPMESRILNDKRSQALVSLLEFNWLTQK
jgi:hypothetical protein